MDINWNNMSDEELRAALAAINTELTERDKAKSRKLINAIDKAIKDFRNEYPTARWMVEIEDDDGIPYEINIFVFNLDTNLITPYSS